MLSERESEITVEYNLPIPGAYRPRTLLAELGTPPRGRAPRVARLVALAHKLEELVRSGVVTSYGELARLGYISPARLSQILILAQLAPSIQECVLFLSADNEGVITELDLRKIAREPRWDRQRTQFERQLGRLAKVKSPSA
jgi:hypothetical protein